MKNDRAIGVYSILLFLILSLKFCILIHLPRYFLCLAGARPIWRENSEGIYKVKLLGHKTALWIHLGADLPSCLQLAHQSMLCLVDTRVLLTSFCLDRGPVNTWHVNAEQIINIVHLTGHMCVQLISCPLSLGSETTTQKSLLCSNHSFKAPDFYEGFFNDSWLSRLPLKHPFVELVCFHYIMCLV